MQDKSRVEIQDEIEHHIFIALNSYSSSGVLPFIKVNAPYRHCIHLAIITTLLLANN